MNCIDCSEPLQHNERQVHCKRCTRVIHRECAMEDNFGYLYDERCFEERQRELGNKPIRARVPMRN